MKPRCHSDSMLQTVFSFSFFFSAVDGPITRKRSRSHALFSEETRGVSSDINGINQSEFTLAPSKAWSR